MDICVILYDIKGGLHRDVIVFLILRLDSAGEFFQTLKKNTLFILILHATSILTEGVVVAAEMCLLCHLVCGYIHFCQLAI